LQDPAILGPNVLPPNYFQKFSIVASDYRSAAIFGDVSVPVTDRFRLRGGLRFTHEDKSSTGNIEQGFSGVDIGPVAVNQASLKSDKLTWKAGIDFDVTAQSLLYATVSTGFKSGGVNNLPASIGITTYKPETITAYEIGSKNRLLDNRIQINASAFRYDYKDYQTFTFYQPTGGAFAGTTLFPTLNSQKATFQGGELQAEFALTSADRLSASINVLNNKFNQFVITLPFAAVQNLSGTDVPLSPKTAYTLAYEHKFNLGAAGSLAVGADAHYSGSYLATGNQGAFSGNIPYTQPSYTKTNAHVSWSAGDSGWEVSAFIRNISNKATINTVAGGYPVVPNFFLINAMIDPPRTFGAAVRKDF
jgi:iron complex outermembrane receptor protein